LCCTIHYLIMRVHAVVACLLLFCASSVFAADRAPIWKVFCATKPIFRGRADPIVEPGVLSQHSHKVFGANNFGIGSKSASAIEYYDHIVSSSCTSCSISEDLSNYWIGDLYYDWNNGSYSLVPVGGMTVYYLSRAGATGANRTNPNWQPFPKGLRMTSGNPWRRSYSGKVTERAISYACLGGNIPETPYFPTNATKCPNGLRAQVWFPMCWDGVNLDSPNHQSHMSHPIQAPDGGDCPGTHPVRVPGVFFEVLFSIDDDKFPHGNGRNPFVWSNGDPTGYGLHGDFLNGWPTELVRAALADTACDNNNPAMANGNNVRSCPPLAPFVTDDHDECRISPDAKVNTIEDLGVNHLIDRLPGCNPIQAGPANGVACYDAPGTVTLTNGAKRVLIKPVNSSNYLSTRSNTDSILASVSPSGTLGYSEVFLFAPVDGGGYTMYAEGPEYYVTAANSGTIDIIASKGGASSWETFDLEQNADSTWSIKARSNSKYFTYQASGAVRNTATSILGDGQKFTFVNANEQRQGTVGQQPLENNPADDGSAASHIGASIMALFMIVAIMF